MLASLQTSRTVYISTNRVQGRLSWRHAYVGALEEFSALNGQTGEASSLPETVSLSLAEQNRRNKLQELLAKIEKIERKQHIPARCVCFKNSRDQRPGVCARH